MPNSIYPILEESFSSGKSIQVKHIVTKSSEPPKDNPYSVLRSFEQKAVDMRLAFLPYREIQKELKKYHSYDVTENSIRRWFIEGSPCRTALRWREEQERTEETRNKEQAKERLGNIAYNAIGMLERSLTDNNMSPEQIRIAQDVLDRAGFPKTSKLEGKAEINIHESQRFTDAIINIANSIKK